LKLRSRGPHGALCETCPEAPPFSIWLRRCQEVEQLSRKAQQQANPIPEIRYAEDGSLILNA